MSKPDKKKRQPATILPKTDKQYLLSGMARRLPIAECWLNPNWRESGLATVVVARQHKNGNYTVGTYLIDVYCLGLKQTAFFVNDDEEAYRDTLDHLFEIQDRKKADYVLAHNIIYGGIAYAEDLGLKPVDKNWALTQYILEADEEAIELLDLEFGKGGQPFFVCGPYDKPMEVISKLERSVGRGNFHYVPYDREEDPLGHLPLNFDDYEADSEPDDGEWDKAEVVE